MPLFLFRDGSIRQLTVVPEGVEFGTYQDRRKRPVHVVLDSHSERRLLAAQPRRHSGRLSTATDGIRADSRGGHPQAA
ncbi:MAG: hypothetical protein R6U00_03795 [Prochlorococcaceae cyanobacterium]